MVIFRQKFVNILYACYVAKLYENKEDLINIYNYLANEYLNRNDLNTAKIYVNQALELE